LNTAPHRIVIVGGGAGGLELATALGRKLRRARAQVTLVDCSLTHIWKPLLHEVAAGVLDTGREALSFAAQAKWNHFRFVAGRMDGLDRRRQVIGLAPWQGRISKIETPAAEVGYDTLILAVGSVGNDFGIPGVASNCIFLDSAAQAQDLRDNLLERQMSRATQHISTPLRVVIIGGGATGVELSAELVDANRRLAYYHRARKEGLENLQVTLLEAGARLLPALPERIGRGAQQDLADMGVKVRTSTTVKLAIPTGLRDADGDIIDADVMVWGREFGRPIFYTRLMVLKAIAMVSSWYKARCNRLATPRFSQLGIAPPVPSTAGRLTMWPPSPRRLINRPPSWSKTCSIASMGARCSTSGSRIRAPSFRLPPAIPLAGSSGTVS